MNAPLCIFFVAFLGELCIMYTTANPIYNQKAVAQVLNRLMNEVKAQEQQDGRPALAQLYIRMLENEAQMQDFSDEERAQIESILSWIKKKFNTVGTKIRSGFNKVKNWIG